MKILLPKEAEEARRFVALCGKRYQIPEDVGKITGKLHPKRSKLYKSKLEAEEVVK